MDKNVYDGLDELIQEQFEHLQGLDKGSEEFKEGIALLNNLTKIKNDRDAEYLRTEREERNAKIKFGLEIAGLAITAATAVIGFRQTSLFWKQCLQFEQTGSFTSGATRAFSAGIVREIFKK